MAEIFFLTLYLWNRGKRAEVEHQGCHKIVAGLWGRGWGMGLLYPHLLGETQSKRNSVKQEIRYKGYQPKPNILYVSFTMMMKIASDFGHTSMTRFNLVLQLRIS